MVNRPGMSIRRLMPHRRNGSDSSELMDESSPDEYDLYLRANSVPVPQQSQMRQSTRIKAPPAPITIRKGSTYSRSMSPLPPLPVDTPHSTPSSLNSIDSQSDMFWTANKKAAAVLGLPESAVATTRVGLPRRPPRPGNGYLGSKEQTQQPPRSIMVKAMAETPRPNSPRTLPDGRRSASPRPSNATQELLAPSSPKRSALNVEAEDAEFQPSNIVTAPSPESISELDSPGQPIPVRQKPEDWSDNVKQLIQETDLAFKAVGSALADAKLASYSVERSESPISPTAVPAALSLAPKELPPLPPTPPVELDDNPRPLTPEQNLPILAEPPVPVTPAAPVVTTPTRSASALVSPAPPTSTPVKMATMPVSPMKSKEKKSRTKRNKGWPAVSQAMAARLGLSENVTDILTGQRFKRIEADEMLTPDQIEELKRIREETRKQANLLLKSRPSAESERRPSSVYELPTDMSEDGAAKQNESSGTEESEEDEEEDIIDEWEVRGRTGSTSAPSTPLRSPPRSQSASDSLHMAPISEDGAQFLEEPLVEEPLEETPETERMQRARQHLDILRSEEDERFIYLKSTPYTLNTPMFRHGPITFSKSEVSKMLMKVDDTLDWTAFQMAIMGAAGDLMGGFYDDGDDLDNDVADDITQWFGTLGFESAGELINSSSKSARDSSGSISSSYSSANHSDMDLPIPMVTEYPILTTDACYDTNKFFRSSGLRQWPGAPKRYGSQDSTEIPSDPIVVCGPGGEGDIDASVADSGVPMGYNLGDDLGDFLRWEAEQMCFYGAPRM